MKKLSHLLFLTILAVTGLSSRPQAQLISIPGDDFGHVRAFPNPWRSDVHSSYPLTIDGFPVSAVSTVRIFTIAGELVRTLGGTQSVRWDLCNNSGSRVASGVYIYLVTANGQQRSGKIAVIR